MFLPLLDCFRLSTFLQLRRRRARRGTLLSSLVCSTQMVDNVTSDMYEQYNWEKSVLGHNFNVSRPLLQNAGRSSLVRLFRSWLRRPEEAQFNVSRPLLQNAESSSLVRLFRSWLGTSEEAQIMLGSVLVVFGLWWLVRTVLSLMIHLICPVLVVLLAVICVPQLRSPLMGQNYPVLANILRNILLRLADNIKT